MLDQEKLYYVSVITDERRKNRAQAEIFGRYFVPQDSNYDVDPRQQKYDLDLYRIDIYSGECVSDRIERQYLVSEYELSKYMSVYRRIREFDQVSYVCHDMPICRSADSMLLDRAGFADVTIHVVLGIEPDSLIITN